MSLTNKPTSARPVQEPFRCPGIPAGGILDRRRRQGLSQSRHQSGRGLGRKPGSLRERRDARRRAAREAFEARTRPRHRSEEPQGVEGASPRGGHRRPAIRRRDTGRADCATSNTRTGRTPAGRGMVGRAGSRGETVLRRFAESRNRTCPFSPRTSISRCIRARSWFSTRPPGLLETGSPSRATTTATRGSGSSGRRERRLAARVTCRPTMLASRSRRADRAGSRAARRKRPLG